MKVVETSYSVTEERATIGPVTVTKTTSSGATKPTYQVRVKDYGGFPAKDIALGADELEILLLILRIKREAWGLSHDLTEYGDQ